MRKNDPAYKTLSGTETDAELIAKMVEAPTLMQRPIGILDGKAALGRPVENLLTLL